MDPNNCPVCGLDTSRISFCPIGAELAPNGVVTLGKDFYLDFECLVCGTKIRVWRHVRWNEEASEYLPDLSVEHVEVDKDDGSGEPEHHVLSLADNPELMPFAEAMQEELESALKAWRENPGSGDGGE